MKMLYRRQTKTERSFLSRRNVIVGGFAIIVLFFAFVRPTPIIQMFQSASLSIYSSEQGALNYVADIFSLVISKADLIDENSTLKKQNEILNSDYNIFVDNLKKENLELRNSLGRANMTVKKRIGSAFVVGKPPVVPYGTIAVDFGMSQDIKVGDIALVGDFIVGKIVSVTANHSIVSLFGGKNEKASFLVGDKRLPLEGQGAGFGAFKSDIASGIGNDLINQSARLAEYPDYIFGVVLGADQSGKDQYESLFIQSPVNIFELGIIDIVRNEGSK